MPVEERLNRGWTVAGERTVAVLCARTSASGSIGKCVCVSVCARALGVSNESVAYFLTSDTYIESLLALFAADQKALMRGSYPKVCWYQRGGECGERGGVASRVRGCLHISVSHFKLISHVKQVETVPVWKPTTRAIIARPFSWLRLCHWACVWACVCVHVCMCVLRTWLAFSSFDLSTAAIKQIELKSIFAVMSKLWNCEIM